MLSALDEQSESNSESNFESNSESNSESESESSSNNTSSEEEDEESVVLKKLKAVNEFVKKCKKKNWGREVLGQLNILSQMLGEKKSKGLLDSLLEIINRVDATKKSSWGDKMKRHVTKLCKIVGVKVEKKRGVNYHLEVVNNLIKKKNQQNLHLEKSTQNLLKTLYETGKVETKNRGDLLEHLELAHEKIKKKIEQNNGWNPGERITRCLKKINKKTKIKIEKRGGIL